ncbi:hypothetical protein [Xanthomonas phage DES1]|nr:hypothetical protein [Xanthomonas phage DES1]
MFRDMYEWVVDNKGNIEFVATFVIGFSLIMLKGAMYG